MKFNEQYLYQNYKKIVRTCLNKGCVIPYLIRSQSIPKKYDYTGKEWDNLIKGLSDDVLEVLKRNSMATRIKEQSFFKQNKLKLNNSKSIVLIREFYEKELLDFLKEFPEYTMILQEDVMSKNVEVIKCPATGKARKIGESGEFKHVVDEWGFGHDEITYSDGTTIRFANDGNVLGLDWRGYDWDYLGDDSYQFFDYQKKEILNKYGDDGWDFFKRYASKFASFRGLALNKYLRGIISKKDLRNAMLFEEDYNFMVGEHDRFMSMVDSLDVGMSGSFFSFRVMDNIHNNDALNKRIVSDKGHTSTTVGADIDDLNTFADTKDCWSVFTMYGAGQGCHGAFLGRALLENDGLDWEYELHHNPGQKFERVIIDEEHKIIIQRQYP